MLVVIFPLAGQFDRGKITGSVTDPTNWRHPGKISGPLLGRIDLHIEVPAVPSNELRGQRAGASSAEMRSRVLAARQIQQNRGYVNSLIHIKGGAIIDQIMVHVHRIASQI